MDEITAIEMRMELLWEVASALAVKQLDAEEFKALVERCDDIKRSYQEKQDEAAS